MTIVEVTDKKVNIVPTERVRKIKHVFLFKTTKENGEEGI